MLKRAETILQELEGSNYTLLLEKEHQKLCAKGRQKSLFDLKKKDGENEEILSELEKKLLDIQPDLLRPIDALQILCDLSEMAKKKRKNP
jgi:hypothetical protein